MKFKLGDIIVSDQDGSVGKIVGITGQDEFFDSYRIDWIHNGHPDKIKGSKWASIQPIRVFDSIQHIKVCELGKILDMKSEKEKTYDEELKLASRYYAKRYYGGED